MNPLTQRQIAIDGTLINYYSNAGGADESREVLVFLHGWRSDGTIWFDVAEEMSISTIYCLDFPGFGKSSTPQKTLSLEDYANLVKGFVEKLGLKDSVLVGHSFGGRVAIKLSSTSPDLVKRLVLVDSAGFATPSAKKTALKVVARGVKPFFRPAFMQPLRRRVYAMMGAEDYVATPELKDTFVRVVNEDLTDAMRTIKAHTLIVWGEQDQETPLSMGQRMNSLIPGSRLEIIKDAGHFSFLDHPTIFIKLLRAYLV